MQSSAGVAGRALIMLACVVGIPVLAMSGTSWSDIVKKLQDIPWPAILDRANASTSPSTDAPHRMASFASTTPAAADTSLVPARQSPSAQQPNSGVVPAAYQAPVDSRTAGPVPIATVPAEQHASVATQPGSDPFHSIQDRLKELGATYYLLESWGTQQQMYRFYCRMAIGGNPSYTHYFEAMEPDPVQAMLGVLRQVESWHQSGAGMAVQ